MILVARGVSPGVVHANLPNSNAVITEEMRFTYINESAMLGTNDG